MDEIETLKSVLATLKNDVADIKKMVQELHAVQTGSLFKVDDKKKLTTAQKRKQAEAEKEAEIQRAVNNANRASMNRL